MAKSKVPHFYKVVIKEYLMYEIPKIFDKTNIPDFYVTKEVIELVYESWKRDCLIQEQKSDFLKKLYNRARKRHKRYDMLIPIDMSFIE